ncbi:uncharacterized protein [Battus philenor]|uniref:uncharacterized protein n=1 Tax=Battus philenor TaxID=42288 RepID=UPI0035CF06BB
MTDNNAKVSWAGPNSIRNVLTVVVISTNADVVEKISDALVEMHNNGSFKWKLITLRSFDLDDIATQTHLTGKVAIDFIVLAMDTKSLFCIEWTENVLSQVHPDLRSRRVVLVNAGGQPVNAMAVNASDVITFAMENKLDMLNANVFNQNEALLLAQRILRYMEVTIGVNTGIPNINI